MTLRFIDSFDDRSTANAAFKWSISNSTNTISTSYGRYGQGLYLSGDGNQWLALALDTAQDTWIIGFAWKSNQKYINNNILFVLYEAGNVQLTIRTHQDNRIRVYNSGSAILATSSPALLAQTWQYLEFKFKINNTVGTIDIRVNGVSVCSASGLDTSSTNNAWASEFRFTGAGEASIDDFYICDGASSDTFRGDVRVETLLPGGAGNYATWTPSAGSNYQNVDDAYASAPCPDGDTTYNSSTTTTNRDSFAYGNLVITAGTILGVQASPNAMKTDAGTRQIKSFARISSTDYDGAAKSVGGSYASYPDLWIISPNTSAAWTVAEVNGAEFGILDFA